MPADEARAFEAAQYALRSAFFFRVHDAWESMLAAVVPGLVGADWSRRDDFGISQLAWDRVTGSGTSPELVFPNPAIISANPRSVAYYRCLALLSQKGLGYLAFGTKNIELGNARALTNARADQLSHVLNGLISLQIESDPAWSLENAYAAARLNLGTQIQGLWSNAIGKEGSNQVRIVLTAGLAEAGLITKALLEDGSELTPPVEPTCAVLVRELFISNGHTVRFAPEPDVAFRDGTGRLTGTIEVKYGSDPAAALERYGAARKSFEAAVHENARVQNIYLANAITPEVRNRIDADRLVTEVYDFRAILADNDARELFLHFVERRLLDV